MATKPAKILVLILALSFIIIPATSYSVEQGDQERLIRRITPPMAVVEEGAAKKDEWYVNSYYEPSQVLQGNKTGSWDELTTLFGYVHQKVRSYISVSQLERFDNKDYTANFGSYISLKNSYFHGERDYRYNGPHRILSRNIF